MKHRRKQTHSFDGSIEKEEEQDAFECQHIEDNSDLPSPFDVHAVRLPLRGHLSWSKRRFSVAFWVRLNSAIHSVGCDLSHEGPLSELEDSFSELEFAADDILHLCSFGTERNLIEIWLIPSSNSFVYKYVKSEMRCI